MVTFGDGFRGRTVWLSGHTGFVGAWLAEWLLGLGVTIHGYGLAPAGSPSLFEQLGLAGRLDHQVGDVRDREAVAASLAAAQPDYVFHLAAATPGAEPAEAYAVNVMGTVYVLEALRTLGKPCAVVCVTSGGCYEDRGWVHGYREDDALGGQGTSGASQAMAELALGAYRREFLDAHNPVRVASARLGQTIGGGDWSEGRVVPDAIRALQWGEKIPVRHPTLVRPWLHVLDALSGCLWLAACLAQPEGGAAWAEAFNFGPATTAGRTAADLVQELLKHWPGGWEDRSDVGGPPPGPARLQLSIDRAQNDLRWSPAWDFAAAARYTMAWYRDARMYKQSANFKRLTQDQIRQYSEAARSAGVIWTKS